MVGKKIKTLDEMVEIRKSLKAQKKTVVFANGCFDILHVGHTRYLNAAKSLGDVLIVGLNSDVSVKKIKGAGRPIICQKERMRIVASLQSVDYVFVFDDLSADSVLLALKPDIHAKGTDYSEETVPERETVKSYGGIVAIVGDPKSHSTRDIIGNIKSRFKTG